MPLQSRQSHVL